MEKLPVDPGQQQMPPGGETAGQDTPEEQAEFQRGVEALSRALYDDDKVSDSILAMFVKDDPVGSTAKAVISLVTELDKKLDLDETVISSIGVLAADRYMDLIKESGAYEYPEIQAQQVVMTVHEGLMAAYGGASDEEIQQATAGMGEQELGALQAEHGRVLNG